MSDWNPEALAQTILCIGDGSASSTMVPEQEALRRHQSLHGSLDAVYDIPRLVEYQRLFKGPQKYTLIVSMKKCFKDPSNACRWPLKLFSEVEHDDIKSWDTTPNYM